MKRGFVIRKGDQVRMTEEAIKRYGEEYRGRVLTVTHVAWYYMPAEEFYAKGRPNGFHPGYDGSGGNPSLYDFEEIEFSLYQWEVRRVR